MGVKFRVMAGTTYLGCCNSMKEARTLLLDSGVALCSKSDSAKEVELFRAVYPLFADWMPSDYLTHQAVLTKTAARDIRHSPAVYQLWIRGATYDIFLDTPATDFPRTVFRNGAFFFGGEGARGGIILTHAFGDGDHEVAGFRLSK